MGLQRESGLLDRIGGGVVEGGTAALKAATFAAEIATDPSALARHVSSGIWAELADSAKALVIDKVLHAAKWLVENGPINWQGDVSFLARLLQHGMIGFLDRAISYDPAFKIRVVDRLMKLLANPTPEFALGFLTGFLKGLWDGVTGPFVLLWDLTKLGYSITELEVKLVATLADTDKRKVLVEDAKNLIDKAAGIIGPALKEALSGKSDPAALLKLVDRLIQGVLGQMQGVGGSIADALVRFLQQPDRPLGEGVGWVTGSAAFEVALLVLTEGGYTALKEAAVGAKWVTEALATAAEVGARVETALAPMLAALARFKVLLTTTFRGLEGVTEVFEEFFALLIKFLKMSYGLDTAAEKGASQAGGKLGAGERAGAHGLAAGERAAVVSERTVINAMGEEHVIAVLVDGTIRRCSDRCARIADGMAERAARLLHDTDGSGAKLADKASALADDSAKLAAEGLTEQERLARLKPIEEQAEALERQMSLLEKRDVKRAADAAQVVEKEMARIDAEIAAGTHKRSFTQSELDWLNADPRHKRLAYDDAIKSYRVDEAQDILLAEKSGVVPGPVDGGVRGGRIDFFDGNGVGWSHKGTRGRATVDATVEKVVSDASARTPVLCDLRHLTDAQTAHETIVKKLQAVARHAEVRFVPPSFTGITAT